MSIKCASILVFGKLTLKQKRDEAGKNNLAQDAVYREKIIADEGSREEDYDENCETSV